MRINPRLVIVIGLFVVVIVGFAVFRDRLSGAADALAVGDCFDVPTGQTSVNEVQHHPCNEAHTAEVVGQADMPANGNAPYPSNGEIRDFAEELCVRTFNEYTGRNVETDDELTVGWFYPIPEGWASGDREVTCYLTRLDDAPMTRSFKKAA